MRIQALSLMGLVCTVALAMVPTARAQDWEAVEITTRQVAPGVYMLMGRGGNLGVSVGDDGVFLIDDQYAPLTDKIVAAIRAISDGPIRFVINTHWHGDHTGGNENLGKTGTLIVAHDNVRRRMSVDQFIAGLDLQVAASPQAALPVVTFSETVTFHLNGDELYVFHVEHAHTDGDAVIHFRESNVVHAGDIYFAGGYPFIDVSSGGSIDGTIAAVDQVLALVDDDTAIIPGHGELSNKAELSEYRAMLAGVRDAIAAEIAKGASVDEVVAARPTAPWDKQWSSAWTNPEQFTRHVYSDLSNIEY
jgi:glyoxylase-like metal-dependent hydrolase (beta-lactamase superfamily II)